jgi:Uma2 family endonuclease
MLETPTGHEHGAPRAHRATDVAVICDPNKLDDAGCRGAPDWIIEVLSPSTAAKDQTGKLRFYKRHRVREYWLVHPIERVLTVYQVDGDAYGLPPIQTLGGETASAAVPGLHVRWPAPEAEPTALPSPGGAKD